MTVTQDKLHVELEHSAEEFLSFEAKGMTFAVKPGEVLEIEL